MSISLWVCALVGSLLVAELVALGALLNGEEPGRFSKGVVVIAITLGILVFASLPLLSRLRAINDRLTSRWWRVLREVGFVLFLVFVLLTTVNVLPATWLAEAGALVVIVLVMVAGIAMRVESARKLRGEASDRNDG